ADFSAEFTGSKTVAWGAAPTTLYLKTISVDDATIPVYYKLNLYATKEVSFTATQIGGTGGNPNVKTTTGVAIEFDEDVDFNASNIVLTAGTGRATKGTFTKVDAKNYILELSGVASGTVNARIASWSGYSTKNANQGDGDSNDTRRLDVYLDKTPPTAKVTYTGRTIMEFLNEVTFGLFFKNTVSAEITAYDTNGDGPDEVYYTKSDELIDEGDLPDANWTKSSSFVQSSKAKFFLYAKVTDKAGNANYYKDGIVVYSDSPTSANEIVFTKASDEDKTTTVEMNGNAIASIMNDMGTPGGGDDEELGSGDDYTVNGDTIAFDAEYLDSLSEGSYTLTISYKPMDEEYVPDPRGDEGADLNAVPGVTTINLSVNKAAADVTLTASPENRAIYGANNVTLTASVENKGKVATGKIIFYEDAGTTNPLGTTEQQTGVDLNESGSVSISITLDAGTYNGIRAEYAGDENYASGTITLAAYEVVAKDQTGIVIKDDSAPANVLSGTTINKDREDGSFSVKAEGGQSGENYVWNSSDTTVATVSPSGDKNASASVNIVNTSGAGGQTTITLKRLGNNNYNESPSASFTLNVAAETTTPVRGGSGVIAFATPVRDADSDPETWSVTLNWTRATDAFPVGRNDKLNYKIYSSTSVTSDIGTVDDCEGEGTLLNGTGGANLASYKAEGLSADTAYWFNVVVTDEAGNKEVYTPVRVVTPRTVSFAVEQAGGSDGVLATSSVKVTFSENVAEFNANSVAFSSGIAGLAVGDAGDQDPKTWTIPLNLTEYTGDNGDNASLTIYTWEASNGHKYILSDDDNTENFKVYIPVPLNTPSASIDYGNRRLAGLTAGATYTFNGDEQTLPTGGDAPGTYSIDDEWHGDSVTIIRKAVPGDKHVDSAEQTLSVPARPLVPGAEVTQPVSSSNTGKMKIIPGEDADADTVYEYCCTSGGDPEEWTRLDESNSDYDASTKTLSGLSGGRYRLRVAAVPAPDAQTPGKFYSQSTFFYVHDYDEYDFEAELEGYSLGSSSDPTNPLRPKTIEADAGLTIQDVDFEDDPSDSDDMDPSDAEDAFYIDDSVSGTWTIQPEDGLFSEDNGDAPKTYRATIKISCLDGSSNTVEILRKVLFIVHPKVKFVSAAASSVNATPEGQTNRLTLTFAYPTTIDFDQVIAGGAASKVGTGFKSVSSDKKVYTLELAVNKYTTGAGSRSYRTGDAIVTGVRIDGDDERHDFQANEEGGTVHPAANPTVTVPREIEKADVLPVLSGYANIIMQFELGHDALGLDPSGIKLSDIVLTGYDEDGPVSVQVTDFYRVDYDRDTNDSRNFFTFRAAFMAAKDCNLRIALPNYSIAAFDVEGDVVAKDAAHTFDDFAYALDGAGNNYLTDEEDFQVLPTLDAANEGNPYVAPKLELRMDREFATSGSKAAELKYIYVDGELFVDASNPDHADRFSVEGGGASPHIFDGANMGSLTNQLTVTLNEDWTREEGTYDVILVLKDLSADDAAKDANLDDLVDSLRVTVTNITPTYKLTLEKGVGSNADPTSSSSYGTSDGFFEAGRNVTITAGNPASGYKFGSWTQTSGAQIASLPSSYSGTVAMPSASDLIAETGGVGDTPGSPVTLKANYVDGTPPVTTIAPANGSRTKTGLVTLTATDVDVTAEGNEGTVLSTHYTIDGGPQQTYSGSSFSLASEGAHTVTYWSIDLLGNKEAEKTASIVYDATPPETSVTIKGVTYDTFNAPASYTRFYEGAVPTVGFAANDGTGSGTSKIEYLIHEYANPGDTLTPLFANGDAAIGSTDAGWTEWEEADGPVNLAESGEYGAYQVYVRAEDAAGNKATASSEGIVYYRDSEITDPSNGVLTNFSRFEAQDRTATLSLNGNAVASIENDMGTAETNDDATLTAGQYTVSGSTLTIPS
ncbi:MAG: Ig-like domain repeat protein, partial [Clostridiales Family XIII bacterium]|nr:Ig-like domain repeat protein [Clostridiales Family XIII bacterium]